MHITSKGKLWEFFHSFWMVFTWTGFLSGLSYVLYGMTHKNWRSWGAFNGTVFTIPVIIYMAFVPKFGWFGFHLILIVANAVLASYNALYSRKMLLVSKERRSLEKQIGLVIPPVDLNVCQLSDLTRIPEFSQRLAAKTIQVRQRIGPFRSIEHFGSLLNLPPRCLDKYRPYLSNQSVHDLRVPVVDL